MQYHVVFSLPNACIYEGPGKHDDSSYATFEEAKAAAIEDLEHWAAKIESNLAELKNAQAMSDLSYHQK